jgi:hypothetical protein
MRSKNTLEYLVLWEQLNNPNFKGAEFDPLLKEVGSVVTYYYFIFSPFPLFSFIYVNNVLEIENQEETPIKWGKKRLKIFP